MLWKQLVCNPAQAIPAGSNNQEQVQDNNELTAAYNENQEGSCDVHSRDTKPAQTRH